MSDLISRSKLLEELKKSRKYHAQNGRELELLCRCENIVNEQPSVPDTNVGSKWIPCSERLPENNGNYMTCDEEGNIHIFWYDDCQKYPFNISEYHTRYYPVIAWQPLPQPYKGE